MANGKNKNSKIRYDELDLLKVISILMVLFLHAGLFRTDFISNPSFPTFAQFGMRIISEGVPIFVLVNGFLLLGKPYDAKKHFKKVRNMMLLLLIWAAIIYVVIEGLFLHVDLSVADFARNFLTLNISTPHLGLLWFLADLLVVYLLFPVVKSLYDRDKKSYGYLFKLVAFFTVGLNLITLLTNFINLWLNRQELTLVPEFIGQFNAFGGIAFFLFYFMLGGYLCEKRDKIKTLNKRKIIILSLLSFIVIFGYGLACSYKQGSLIDGGYNYGTIFLTIIIFGMYLLSLSYRDKEKIHNRLIKDISKNTLGIYLTHYIVIVGINYYVEYPADNFMLRLSYAAVVFVISYAIVKLIRLIPVIRRIVAL